MSEPEAKPHTPTERKPSPEEESRRKFLERLSIGVFGVGATMLVVPVAGFFLAPFFLKVPQVWRSVGKVESFKIGETKAVTFPDASPLPWAGVAAKTGAWLRRVDAENFIAFSLNCTHLGCPVRWIADASLFMCPCHGGVYYADGEVAAGPPPKPLPRFEVRIQNDDVQILTRPIPITR
jgi:menaquinol-cytochrome c reductase iron-sulfur subunit